MSGEFAFKRVTAPDIAKRKGGAPIVALTAYHAHTARIIDPYVDMLLVGDSLGMVMHGYETTVPGAARADDHACAGRGARLHPRARGRGHAFRLL